MKNYLTAMLIAFLSVGTPAFAVVNIKGETTGSINVGGNADASTSVKTEVKADAAAGTSATNSEKSAEESSVITITADAISASADLSVKSSAAVQSDTQLSSYARNVVKANTEVRDVKLSETQVTVSHRQHARVFGVVPTKVYARATVLSDGSVKVKFPWYAAAGKTKAEIESKVKASVNAVIPTASAEAAMSAKFTAQTQAQVLEKAIAALQAQFQADAKTKAKVN